MKALIENGVVRQISETEFPVSKSLEWVAIPEGQTAEYGYLWDGQVFSVPEELPAPPPTVQELIDGLTQQTNDLLAYATGEITLDALKSKYSGKLK